MSDSFTALTHFLSTNEFWLDARPEHQAIFIALLMRCAYRETIHDINGHKETIYPGQVAAALRKMAEWTSKYTNKNEVVACLKYFAECQFLRHEVRHGKTIVTFTQLEVCSRAFGYSQTQTQTGSRQDPDTKIHINTITPDPDLIDSSKSSDWICLNHEESGQIKMLKSEAIEELQDLGWTLIEINKIINQVIKFNPTLSGGIVKYLLKSLQNNKQGKSKCTSKTEKSCPTRKPSKTPSSNANSNAWENDTSAPLLAQFAEKRGYSKKL